MLDPPRLLNAVVTDSFSPPRIAEPMTGAVVPVPPGQRGEGLGKATVQIGFVAEPALPAAFEQPLETNRYQPGRPARQSESDLPLYGNAHVRPGSNAQ
jgi:hypothetical protein